VNEGAGRRLVVLARVVRLFWDSKSRKKKIEYKCMVHHIFIASCIIYVSSYIIHGRTKRRTSRISRHVVVVP
jgi:hypothetical protein